ncbi:hypothetical protein IAR50_005523 [Cryptococcus sp. DSM 104548]
MSSVSPDRPPHAPLQLHRTPSNNPSGSSGSFTTLKDKMVRALSPNRAEALGEERGRRPSWGGTWRFL